MKQTIPSYLVMTIPSYLVISSVSLKDFYSHSSHSLLCSCTSVIGYCSWLLACLSALFICEFKGRDYVLLMLVFSEPSTWHVLNIQ